MEGLCQEECEVAAGQLVANLGFRIASRVVQGAGSYLAPALIPSGRSNPQTAIQGAGVRLGERKLHRINTALRAVKSKTMH